MSNPIPALAICLPLLGALLVLANKDRPNLRDGISLVTTVLLFFLVLSLYGPVMAGEQPAWQFISPIPGLAMGFRVEPLGLMFATVASGLWIVTTVYAIGYMRRNKEKRHTMFFFCFAVAIAAAMGVAFSADLLTLFVFYEALTLSTYPLVAHKQTKEARRGAKIYLAFLLTTSIGLLLVAIIATYATAGTLQFTPGGVLTDKLSVTGLTILVCLFCFGIGKAALMPVHRWLPTAMVAPTPVSALLHAVAVVKAGVFTIVKVVVYIIGVDNLAQTGAGDIVLWTAAFTLTFASVIALRKDNLKARLAYSTVAQLAYVVLGAMLANSAGLLGASMQIPMHAVGKITLFFCAGSIYVATHKTEISQLDGLGHRMPFTFAAFFIGSVSIIGLPPMGGAWSKWFLLMGTADAQQWILMGLLLLSSLMNIAYLLPIVGRGFFRPLPAEEASRLPAGTIEESPMTCVIPLSVTAAGCVALFLYADAIHDFLLPLFP